MTEDSFIEALKEAKFISSNSKSNGKVTKIGQKFKVKLSSTMRDDKFWEEDKIYTCDNIVEFEGLDNEIYVGDNWISDSFTMVV
jgi:hypothetical protein